MACIVPVCSIAREKSERITRAEIEQKSADEFINGLMSRMTVDEKIGQLNLPSYGNVMPNPKKSEIASRIVRGEVGGIFNIFGVDAIRQLQEVADLAAQNIMSVAVKVRWLYLRSSQEWELKHLVI